MPNPDSVHTDGNFSDTFPRLEDWYVQRDTIIENIDFHLRNGIDVLLLDGDEGYGKTTALAQLALRLQNRCLCTFARRDDKLFGHPDVLRADLYRQVRRLLDAHDTATDSSDQAVWWSALTALRRAARSEKETIVFIVDGLNTFGDRDAVTLDAIMELYPIGTPDFQFVISTTRAKPLVRAPSNTQSRTLPISIVQPAEARQILHPFSLTDEQFHTVKSLCNGSPGKLASVRRRLAYGDRIDEILAESPASDKSFYAGEWKAASTGDRLVRLMLALLAADDRPRTTNDIAHLLNIESADVKTSLEKCSFLRIDADMLTVEYQNDAFRRYASEKLGDVMADALDILIRELRQSPETDSSLTQLPRLLERRDDKNALVGLLSADYFGNITSLSQSLSAVREIAAIGARAARRQSRDSDLLRFGLYQATVNALSSESPRKSEVEAYLALGDANHALLVAQAAKKIEERLELLVVVARHRRDKGLPPDPTLLTDIKELATRADVALLGTRATALAADLFVVDPALAIGVMDRSASPVASQRHRDWSLVRMALESARRSGQAALGAYETVYERVTDPEVKRFINLISGMLSDQGGAQILALVAEMEPRDQLGVLQEWLKFSNSRDDAIDVAEHALGLAVATRDFTITFALLRDLAGALRGAGIRERADKFASLLQDHAAANADRGSSVDLVELRLRLGEYRLRGDYAAGGEQFLDIYLFVETIQDLFVRAMADARILQSLTATPEASRLEADFQLRWQVSQRLQSSVETVLLTSADHYRAMSPIVVALADADPILAEVIAGKLNTRLRRELCIRDLAVQLMTRTDQPPLATVQRLTAALQYSHIKDELRMAVLEWVRRQPALAVQRIHELERTLLDIEAILDSESRCQASAIVLLLLSRLADPSITSLTRTRFADLLRESWESIDEIWRRIAVGYSVVALLAESSPVDANQLLTDVEALRQSSALTSGAAASAVINQTHLAIRAFAGVVEQGFEAEVEAAEDALGSLIARVPANGVQSQLWAAVALKYFALKRDADGRRIVDRRVRPLFESIARLDKRYRRDALLVIAPALFCAHADMALDELTSVDQPLDDYILDGLVAFLIRGVPETEPYAGRGGRGAPLSIGTLADIAKLLERTKLDWVIWSKLAALSRALSSTKQKDELTVDERTQIVNRLRAIVARLPLPNCIQHDGPAVVASAFLLRLERAKAQAWRPLIERASRIPNSADRALVRYTLAETMPASGGSEREQLLEHATQDARGIGSLPDRAERLVGVAEATGTQDSAAPLLREALECARDSSAEQADDIRRRVLDAAYRLDEKLASELAAAIDKDPKRKEVREAKRRLKVLATNKQLGETRPQLASRLTTSESNEAAYMAIAALNARLRRPVRPTEAARDILTAAGAAPIHETYWVFAWAIENLVHRQDRSEHARNTVQATFFAAVQGAELAWALSEQSAAGSIAARAAIAGIPQGIVVGSRDRERALAFLRDWLPKQRSETVIICDPYFGPDDLDIVELIHWCKPDAQIVVISGYDPHGRIESPLGDVYRRAWRELSDQEPPHCEVTVVFEEAPPHKCPIHDRWLILDEVGLAIGPSSAGIGVGRIGSLVPISGSDAAEALSTIAPFLARTARSYGGKRIAYRALSLRDV